MKKIIFSILSVGLLFTSCDMDLTEPGTTPDTEAIQSVEDVKKFRNNCYNTLRGITSGTYVTDSELQSDLFIGLNGNGNRGAIIARGLIDPSTESIGNKYAAIYGSMKNINFMLEQTQKLIDAGTFDETQLVEVNRYVGEAKFTRAYLYFYLFDHYCQPYSTDKAEQEGLGLQIVDKYDPSVGVAGYPGRGTMNAAIKFINDDLADAYTKIAAYEQIDASNVAPCAPYLSTFAVAAMQARVALTIGDNKTAITKSQYVTSAINTFALAEGEDYINMWVTDKSTEVIFQPFVNLAEAGSVSSYSEAINYILYPERVDYVPTLDVLMNYDNYDIRFDAFFKAVPMKVDAKETAGYVFIKYIGNPELDPSTGKAYKNIPKPFRLSEQYLILAEAAAQDNQPAVANKALNDLRAKRITGYAEQNFTGAALINEIRAERAKELIGEGFRISDLRRWGLGFSRNSDYIEFNGFTPLSELFVSIDANTVYIPGDYRYTWPIPYDEMQVTPALEGQQNPGY